MTDNYLEETQLFSEKTDDLLSIENVANYNAMEENISSDNKKTSEKAISLSITESLKNGIDSASSALSSLNEWLKENDPFSLPVAEAKSGEKYSEKMYKAFSDTGPKPFNNIIKKDSPRNYVYADNTGHRTFSSTSQDGQSKVTIDHTKNYNSVKIEHKGASGSVVITKNGGAQAKLEYKKEF